MEFTLTPSQVDAYLHRIGLPQKYFPSSNPPIDLAYITALHVHHITSIPYENLSIHYSSEHHVSLVPAVLYDKIVASGRGRGGYCMEDGLLFHYLLRALGLRTYMAPARSRSRDLNNVPSGDYVGISHLVHIVTLADGARYALDVSFGGDGPTLPLPLQAGVALTNLGSQQVRLMHQHLPRHREPDGQPKHWIYEYRNGEDKEWNAFYSFAEYEFFPEDFIAINYGVAKDPVDSWQTALVLLVKFVLGRRDDGREGVVGKVMMKDGVLKRNMGGKTELLKTCETEAERVEVIKEWFGITLTPEEQASIKGWRTELKR